jgi:hypothetical protein
MRNVVKMDSCGWGCPTVGLQLVQMIYLMRDSCVVVRSDVVPLGIKNDARYRRERGFGE